MKSGARPTDPGYRLHLDLQLERFPGASFGWSKMGTHLGNPDGNMDENLRSPGGLILTRTDLRVPDPPKS